MYCTCSDRSNSVVICLLLDKSGKILCCFLKILYVSFCVHFTLYETLNEKTNSFGFRPGLTNRPVQSQKHAI